MVIYQHKNNTKQQYTSKEASLRDNLEHLGNLGTIGDIGSPVYPNGKHSEIPKYVFWTIPRK